MSLGQRLTAVLLLNVALVTALVAVGLAAHSLAVLAAGADYLADAAAIGVSLLATWLASRPPTPARPQGYRRATTIAALVNAGNPATAPDHRRPQVAHRGRRRRLPRAMRVASGARA